MERVYVVVYGLTSCPELAVKAYYIHSANSKCGVYFEICRPSTYIMVSILHRCISSLVSRWLPSSLQLRQQLGLISQMSRPMVCATVIFCFCSLLSSSWYQNLNLCINVK